MRRFRSYAALTLALSTAALASSVVEAQQPVFRSGTSVVEVHVVVRDRAGKFVEGLGPADLQISEDGQPAAIELMYAVTGPRGTTTAGAAGLATRQAPRTFVFAFDVAHLSPRSMTRARDAAVEFAKRKVAAGDRTAAVAVGQSTSLQVRDDSSALVRALEALRPSTELTVRERALREWPRILSHQEAVEIARNNARVVDEARSRECHARQLDCENGAGEPAPAPGGKNPAALKGMGDRETTESELRAKASHYVAQTTAVAMRSIGSLEALTRALETIRGRKTVIWFTEGTPILEAGRQAQDAAARAAQSGVAVYSVDPRGLQSRTAGVEEIATQDVGLDMFSDTSDLATLMASGTGAIAIRNENRLDRALERIDDDTSNYYVVGYAAGAATNRGGRRLSITVKRDGLDARLRHGFMAPQHGYTRPGAMVASAMNSVPGTEAVLRAPRSTPPTRPTPPPSTLTTVPTPTHVPTTEKVLRLRDAATDASDLASRGWAAYERGEIEAALPLLEQASRRADVRPWALYALGFTYIGANRTRDAVAAWERVRAAAPDFQPVYLDLAAHYAQLGEHGNAIARLRAAEQRWPSDPEIHNGIGVLLVKRMAYEEAIAAFGRATTVAPADALSWLNLGRAHELRYDRLRRYDQMLLKWVGPEADRVKAQQSYEKCIALGGPYAEQAAEALARMNWSQ